MVIINWLKKIQLIKYINTNNHGNNERNTKMVNKRKLVLIAKKHYIKDGRKAQKHTPAIATVTEYNRRNQQAQEPVIVLKTTALFQAPTSTRTNNRSKSSTVNLLNAYWPNRIIRPWSLIYVKNREVQGKY